MRKTHFSMWTTCNAYLFFDAIYLCKPPGYFRLSYGAKPNSLSLTCACLCELFCSVPLHLWRIKAGSLLECESGFCIWTRWMWQIGTPQCQGNWKCSETYDGFVRECAPVRVCQLLCAYVSVREQEKWVRKTGRHGIMCNDPLDGRGCSSSICLVKNWTSIS